MKLSKSPSVMEETNWTSDGFVETESGLLVPAYVGSDLGFNHPGRCFLYKEFYPQLRDEAGVFALCPFKACGEYIDLSKLNDDMTVREHKEFWNRFHAILGEVNYQWLIPRSKFTIAILEGHTVDAGVASEVTYTALRQHKVIGIRSDFRLAENLAAPINPAVRHFIDTDEYPGEFYLGQNAYDNAARGIRELTDILLQNSNQ